MNKEEKFKKLDELNLTRAEAEAYFAQKEQSISSQSCTSTQRYIPTPLPIAYKKQNSLYMQPYLDMEEKENVWGIVAGDIILKKTAFLGDRRRAEKACINENFGAYKGHLPSISECKEMLQDKMRFDRTVDILNQHNIEADKLSDDNYWCQDVFCGLFYAFNFALKTYIMTVHSSKSGIKVRVIYR